jgi:pilus assembly protein CpaB
VNVRQIAIIAIAIVLAGGSFVMMKRQNKAALQNTNVVAAPAAPAVKAIKVLVTNKDYLTGDRILPGTLVWQDWPANSTTTSFIVQDTNPKAAETFNDAVVAMQMFAGEPIVLSKIVLANAKDSVMSALLTPGMRATSVTITPDSAVAGFILPNSRVDVLLTRKVDMQINNQTASRTVSSTILENVRVLAIDQATSTAKDQKAFAGTTATLELNPQDAEKIKAADSLGDISLLLRAMTDSNGPTVSRADALAMSQPTPSAQRQTNPTQQAAQAPNTPNGNMVAANAAANIKIYRGGQ